MRSKGKQWFPDGKHLVLELPSGGGYGDPQTRDHAQVEQDVVREYISVEQAEQDYRKSD
jgi:N-methylhydantoinase B